jgi:hypothetical protein
MLLVRNSRGVRPGRRDLEAAGGFAPAQRAFQVNQQFVATVMRVSRP